MKDDDSQDFEPGLPPEELERRILSAHKQVLDGEAAADFYRSLGAKDLDEKDDDPADGIAISAEFTGEEAEIMLKARALVSAKLGRPASDQDLMNYMIETLRRQG